MSESTTGRVRRPGGRTMLIAAAVALVAIAALAAIRIVPDIGKRTIHADFVSTSGVYVGDDVRVLGVPVGRITAIDAGDEHVRVTMSIDDRADLPADAKAVVIAQSLVSARFVQLTPVRSDGPALEDGATIPVERTASPVEWDEIKTQLTRLAESVGPDGLDPQGSLGRFVDSGADALAGNGQSVRDTLRELSDTMSTLSDGRTDLFGTIRNLQAFVTVLSQSNDQIVQVGGRLQSVSQVLADSSGQLGESLTALDGALSDVQRFVHDNRETMVESMDRLAEATQIVVDNRPTIERILHGAPTSLANFYQVYKPLQGSLTGALSINNLASPIEFMCGSIATGPGESYERSAELCKQQLGPVLESMTMNYLPFSTNPVGTMQADPSQLRFTDPDTQARAQERRSDMSSVEVPAADILGPGIPAADGLAGLLQPFVPQPPAPGGTP